MHQNGNEHNESHIRGEVTCILRKDGRGTFRNLIIDVKKAPCHLELCVRSESKVVKPAQLKLSVLPLKDYVRSIELSIIHSQELADQKATQSSSTSSHRMNGVLTSTPLTFDAGSKYPVIKVYCSVVTQCFPRFLLILRCIYQCTLRLEDASSTYDQRWPESLRLNVDLPHVNYLAVVSCYSPAQYNQSMSESGSYVFLFVPTAQARMSESGSYTFRVMYEEKRFPFPLKDILEPHELKIHREIVISVRSGQYLFCFAYGSRSLVVISIYVDILLRIVYH